MAVMTTSIGASDARNHCNDELARVCGSNPSYGYAQICGSNGVAH
jgi:hypothetical protein